MNETGFSCSPSEEDEYEGASLCTVVATWERGKNGGGGGGGERPGVCHRI